MYACRHRQTILQRIVRLHVFTAVWARLQLHRDVLSVSMLGHGGRPHAIWLPQLQSYRLGLQPKMTRWHNFRVYTFQPVEIRFSNACEIIIRDVWKNFVYKTNLSCKSESWATCYRSLLFIIIISIKNTCSVSSIIS